MAVQSDAETSNRCIVAAIALSFAHILTVYGGDLQTYAYLRIDKFFWVNHAVFLSPVVALLLMRGVRVFLAIYAVPVLIIFISRMYYVWQFWWFGINSMAVQKGDGLGFIEMVFDMLSAVFVACALLVIFSLKLIGGALRLWKR